MQSRERSLEGFKESSGPGQGLLSCIAKEILFNMVKIKQMKEGRVSAQPGARRGVMGGSPDATFGLGLILSRWGHSPGGRHTISESREGQAHGLFGEQRTLRAGWVRPRCGLLQAVTLLTVKAPHPQNESHTHAPPIPRTRNPRRTS